MSGLDSQGAARRLGERIAAEGLADVSYGHVESPLGTLLVASTKRGLVRLAFPEEGADSVLEHLSRTLSPRIVEAPGSLQRERRELEEYFLGRRREFELALDRTLVGPFARRVLRVGGALGGYAGGLERKRLLLELEREGS